MSLSQLQNLYNIIVPDDIDYRQYSKKNLIRGIKLIAKDNDDVKGIILAVSENLEREKREKIQREREEKEKKEEKERQERKYRSKAWEKYQRCLDALNYTVTQEDLNKVYLQIEKDNLEYAKLESSYEITKKNLKKSGYPYWDNQRIISFHSNGRKLLTSHKKLMRLKEALTTAEEEYKRSILYQTLIDENIKAYDKMKLLGNMLGKSYTKKRKVSQKDKEILKLQIQLEEERKENTARNDEMEKELRRLKEIHQEELEKIKEKYCEGGKRYSGRLRKRKRK